MLVGGRGTYWNARKSWGSGKICGGILATNWRRTDEQQEQARSNANSAPTQVALLPVSLVSPVVVRTAPVRPLSVTCAVVDACSLLPRSGASGTSRSTRDRSMFGSYGLRWCLLMAATNSHSGASLPLPLWLLLPSRLSSSPVATRSPPSPRFLSSSTRPLSRVPSSPRLPPLSVSSRPSVPAPMSRRSRAPRSSAPVRAR